MGSPQPSPFLNMTMHQTQAPATPYAPYAPYAPFMSPISPATCTAMPTAMRPQRAEHTLYNPHSVDNMLTREADHSQPEEPEYKRLRFPGQNDPQCPQQ
jgi:hypothetical protein